MRTFNVISNVILPVLLVGTISEGNMTAQRTLGLCGTLDHTPFEKQLDQLRMNALFTKNRDHDEPRRKLTVPSCTELCKQCIVVDTYFHLSGYHLDFKDPSLGWVIPHPTAEFRKLQEEIKNKTVSPDVTSSGRFSTIENIYQLIENNVNVLNTRYADTPFRFRWVNSDPTKGTVHVDNGNAFFYSGLIYASNNYATAAHQGDRRSLNVYLTYRICGHPFVWLDSNCNTIGAATNPSYQLDGTADGVYMAYDTLTGGGFESHDEGITLVHEVGHWLGLLHVFESETLPDENDGIIDGLDPCDPINVDHGDLVDDTPFLPEPSMALYRCSLTFYEGPGEEIPNSCPNLPGVDPVFNYMNFVDNDACLAEGHGEFTCGQHERMMRQWLMYREYNETCAQGEMELNVTLRLDADSSSFHAELAAFNSGGEAVLNIDRDLDLQLFPGQAVNATRIMNFCVPEDDYVLVVSDAGRDGFDDGFVEVAINGNRIHRVEGNFGSTECIKFDANGIKAKSRSNSPGTAIGEFGEAYHFDASGQDTAVTCRTSNELYMEEPVPVMKGRYMRVAVSLANASHDGVCINDVSRLDISFGGSVMAVLPSEDVATAMFSSEIKECRGDTCIVQFDLGRLEGLNDIKNKNGIYNTTCTANVKLGFGGACDNFLRGGGFDCTESQEMDVSGEGYVVFSKLTSSSPSWSACTALSLIISAVGALLWIP